MSSRWDSSSSSARTSFSSNFSTATQSKLTPHTKHNLIDLQLATKEFSDEKIIVKGEFSITYEGILDTDEGPETVAVKRYDVEGNIVKTYKNELDKLSNINHAKLVALKGYCEDDECDDEEFIIVHEFMKYGTLANHVFGDGPLEEEINLPWKKRLEICIDVAEALVYLHDDFGISRRLIHGNVNPNNILIAEDLTAKLSEFGFSREGKVNTAVSAVNTNARGLAKYVDPHFQMTSQLTRRSDVYSFGIVLLDVLFGKNFPVLDHVVPRQGQKKENIHEWTEKCLNERRLGQFVDERIKGQISEKCLIEFAKLASSCLQNNPPKRPLMPNVLEKLKEILAVTRKTRC